MNFIQLARLEILKNILISGVLIYQIVAAAAKLG